MYVWIYENEAKGLISHTKRAFYSRQKQGGRYKILKDSQSFSFLLLPIYLAFIALLSLICARFHGLEVALESTEIKVK